MHDYHLFFDDGSSIPISDLPTGEIEEILRDGFKILLPHISECSIKQRLELELYIRQNNLRQKAGVA